MLYCDVMTNARRRIPLYNPASLSEHQDRVPMSRSATTTTRRPLRALLLHTNPRYSPVLCLCYPVLWCVYAKTCCCVEHFWLALWCNSRYSDLDCGVIGSNWLLILLHKYLGQVINTLVSLSPKRILYFGTCVWKSGK